MSASGDGEMPRRWHEGRRMRSRDGQSGPPGGASSARRHSRWPRATGSGGLRCAGHARRARRRVSGSGLECQGRELCLFQAPAESSQAQDAVSRI